MNEHEQNLARFFEEQPAVALAFSGGVDSSYLLYAARRAGCRVQPYYVKTCFQPEFEFADAKRLCAELGAEMRVLHADILAVDEVRANPVNRCYFCKRAIFSRILSAAQADGFSLVIDGTNASDDSADRPGMKALQELQVLSPLRVCSLTKSKIRELSREAGLFTWDKPAYACLATRVPTGQTITRELLSRVEGAEGALFALGFTDFRVRVFSDAARVQLKPAQMVRALEQREAILEKLRPYFEIVLLDLNGR